MNNPDEYMDWPRRPKCDATLSLHYRYSKEASGGGNQAYCPNGCVKTHMHGNSMSAWRAAEDGIFTDKDEVWKKG